MTEMMRKYEDQIKELKCVIEDQTLSLSQAEMIQRDYELQLIEKDRRISYLEGMIEAFKICVKRGILKDDR